MVLVDPSIPDQDAISERLRPTTPAMRQQQEQILDIFRTCSAQIRSGSLRLGGPDPKQLRRLSNRLARRR
jgi:hypothetical protein